MAGSGVPAPHLKLIVASTRVNLRDDKSRLSKYSPRSPLPPVSSSDDDVVALSSMASLTQEPAPLPSVPVTTTRESALFLGFFMVLSSLWGAGELFPPFCRTMLCARGVPRGEL